MREDEDTYTWFMNNIVPCVVGKDSYKERVSKLPTKWVTNSSEAFSLLCIENYYEHIMDLAKNKSTIRTPKWTAGARGAMRNQGWNITGIGRFKEIVG